MDLVRNFRQIEHFAYSIMGNDGDSCPEAAFLMTTLIALRRLLRSWPFSSVRVGDVLVGARVSEAFAELSSHLKAVGDAFMQMYLSRLDRGSVSLLLTGGDMGMTQAHHNEAETCAYCGQPVDEIVVFSTDGQRDRVYGHCHGCGPIYDIWPGDGKWIGVDAARTGAKSHFTISAPNCYQFPMHAFSAVAIPPFGAQPPVFDSLQAPSFRPGKQSRYISNWTLPTTSSPAATTSWDLP